MKYNVPEIIARAYVRNQKWMLKKKRNKSPGDTFFVRWYVEKKTPNAWSYKIKIKIITNTNTILKGERNAHGHVYFMLRTRIDRLLGLLGVVLLASGTLSYRKKYERKRTSIEIMTNIKIERSIKDIND